MVDLYIANCTRQKVQFQYRKPEGVEGELAYNHNIVVRDIPIGGQIKINDHPEPSYVIDNIIAQHRRYGLIEEKQVDRTRNFVGLCFNTDRPVDIDSILLADEKNFEYKKEEGIAMRHAVTQANSEKLKQDMRESGLDREMTLTNYELEVIEQQDKSGNTPTLAETISTSSRPRSRGGLRG